MIKKIFSVVGLLCLGGLVACQANATGAATATSAPVDQRTVVGTDLDLLQAGLPQVGDTLVILHTTLGDVTIRMFPEEAPMAYENFVTHAQNGYYDGTIFHRVIQNFMVQGGDPQGTGMGGESIWGEGFGPEFSFNLRHFRGALAMAQSAMPNSIGSQFYIVHNSGLDAGTVEALEEFNLYQDLLLGQEEDGTEIFVRDLYSSDMVEGYLQFGGTPHLDLAMGALQGTGGHTVFGQVVEGMHIVDAIAESEVDSSDRPLEDIIIESTSVITYQG
ncbi:MAG: peptidylprolyl isomerase [Firmicutes bacterium]|nr:peptidylprolyl isomerase [Bacillota bacterium]